MMLCSTRLSFDTEPPTPEKMTPSPLPSMMLPLMVVSVQVEVLDGHVVGIVGDVEAAGQRCALALIAGERHAGVVARPTARDRHVLRVRPGAQASRVARLQRADEALHRRVRRVDG